MARTIIARLIPRFPSNVTGTGGINVTKINGGFQISTDLAQFSDVPGAILQSRGNGIWEGLNPGALGQVLTVLQGGLGYTSIPGSLIGIQAFETSGIYTPTIGTSEILVDVIGAGGGGGGAESTNAAHCSVGSGGASGSYGRIKITNNFSGVTVTIGAGGAGGVGAVNGSAGGQSSFGSLLIAGGGLGGRSISSGTSNFALNGGLPSAAPPSGIINSGGTPGGMCIRFSGTLGIGGAGGTGPFGGAGKATQNFNSVGGDADGEGAGGGGAIATNLTTYNGGAGDNGHVVVYEFG